MHTINDIFSYSQESRSGRRQPKCRLFPPGARLVRV